MKPNLVLINAGTNDCLGRSDPANDPATLPNRLQSLVQVCLFIFVVIIIKES
jgi:hypothetical protein